MSEERVKPEPDEENMPMVMTFRPALSDSDPEEEDNDTESEKDEDVRLIQALQSKVLIRKMRGTVPLRQYSSPNRSPKKKSPSKSPLHPNDLRFVIEREKRRIQEMKVTEQMMKARKKLFERELAEKQLKKTRKRIPKTRPEMTGLCGCRGRCEWYGMCLNLFKDEENSDTNQGDNLNNTI